MRIKVDESPAVADPDHLCFLVDLEDNSMDTQKDLLNNGKDPDQHELQGASSGVVSEVEKEADVLIDLTGVDDAVDRLIENDTKIDVNNDEVKVEVEDKEESSNIIVVSNGDSLSLTLNKDEQKICKDEEIIEIPNATFGKDADPVMTADSTSQTSKKIPVKLEPSNSKSFFSTSDNEDRVVSPKPSTVGTIENSKISPISSSSKSSRRRANRRKRNLEESQGSGGANKLRTDFERFVLSLNAGKRKCGVDRERGREQKAHEDTDEQRLGREREQELAKIELEHQELKRQQQKLNEAKRARERSSDHDLCADVDRKRPRHFGTPPPPRFDTSLFGTPKIKDPAVSSSKTRNCTTSHAIMELDQTHRPTQSGLPNGPQVSVHKDISQQLLAKSKRSEAKKLKNRNKKLRKAGLLPTPPGQTEARLPNQVKNDLDVIITDTSSQKVEMTLQQVNRVKVIVHNAANAQCANLGFCPLFEEAGLVNGMFSVACSDLQSRNWLIDFVPKMNPQPWRGARLNAIPRLEALWRLCINVFLPCEARMSNVAIIRSLILRNRHLPNINIETWTIMRSIWVGREEESSTTGHLVFFSVSAKTHKLLSTEKSPMLYWSMQRVAILLTNKNDVKKGSGSNKNPGPAGSVGCPRHHQQHYSQHT